jgi:hypothetical protein
LTIDTGSLSARKFQEAIHQQEREGYKPKNILIFMVCCYSGRFSTIALADNSQLKRTEILWSAEKEKLNKKLNKNQKNK